MFLAAIRDFLAARTFPERTWLSRSKLFLRLTGPDVAFDDLVGKLVPHHRTNTFERSRCAETK